MEFKKFKFVSCEEEDQDGVVTVTVDKDSCDDCQLSSETGTDKDPVLKFVYHNLGTEVFLRLSTLRQMADAVNKQFPRKKKR